MKSSWRYSWTLWLSQAVNLSINEQILETNHEFHACGRAHSRGCQRSFENPRHREDRLGNRYSRHEEDPSKYFEISHQHPGNTAFGTSMSTFAIIFSKMYIYFLTHWTQASAPFDTLKMKEREDKTLHKILTANKGNFLAGKFETYSCRCHPIPLIK